MQISDPVELVPPQRECALHHWVVQSSGRTVEVEVYTCSHCGAKWQRTIRHRVSQRGNGKTAAVSWPTWDDIIGEP